jgi:hypothetical protein
MRMSIFTSMQEAILIYGICSSRRIIKISYHSIWSTNPQLSCFAYSHLYSINLGEDKREGRKGEGEERGRRKERGGRRGEEGGGTILPVSGSTTLHDILGTN